MNFWISCKISTNLITTCSYDTSQALFVPIPFARFFTFRNRALWVLQKIRACCGIKIYKIQYKRYKYTTIGVLNTSRFHYDFKRISNFHDVLIKINLLKEVVIPGLKIGWYEEGLLHEGNVCVTCICNILKISKHCIVWDYRSIFFTVPYEMIFSSNSSKRTSTHQNVRQVVHNSRVFHKSEYWYDDFWNSKIQKTI